MSATLPSPAENRPVTPSWREPRSEKLRPEHYERLAVVYVRQSSPQQVLNNQESTRLQYSLKDRAIALGWPENRVLVIDDDLGKSGATAEGRAGFQRLVSEIGLGHVGIILGVEMSRLARSCKDWHQLLEVCALFGTLIADLDGIYDPAHYNDRLLLGLKGTMSEAELHILKQRMNEGRLNKARRGELGFPLPIGYVRRPSGEVTLDPDEQAQRVVRLVFRKFEELGTLNAVLQYLVRNNIQLGVRVRDGLAKGELEWRRPNRMTLQNMLHSPIYAGAYAYGRRRTDPRRKKPGHPGTGRRALDLDGCYALLRDRLPAYISWEKYEQDVARLKANRARGTELGAPRHGPSLLSGLLVCAKCGCRMHVQYGSHDNRHAYVCAVQHSSYGGDVCQHIAGRAVDQFVTARVLEALAPAALDLSMEAAKNLQRERDDLRGLWQQRLERAAYESERAARQYRLVEPENRLVARQVEHEWEEKLAQHKKIEEDVHRFEQSQPRLLSDAEREAIRALAADIPALWNAPSTTDADRKEIIRQVVDRVVLDSRGHSERVRVTIHWAGGTQTEGEMIRPVAKLQQLTYYPQLCERIRNLAAEGFPPAAIAERLNAEGYRPPKRRETFGRQQIAQLMGELAVGAHRSRRRTFPTLGEHEWLIPDLAKAIPMSEVTLYNWVHRGWVRARRGQGGGERWILWADEDELKRLRERHQRPAGYYTRRRWVDEPEPLGSQTPCGQVQA